MSQSNLIDLPRNKCQERVRRQRLCLCLSLGKASAPESYVHCFLLLVLPQLLLHHAPLPLLILRPLWKYHGSHPNSES